MENFLKKNYTALKEVGTDIYLLSIETANKELYQKLHFGMSYKNRIRYLMDLKDLNYEVGTGCLIGLPGQTAEMQAEDLIFFKKIDTDMIGGCEGTPLENEKDGNEKQL